MTAAAAAAAAVIRTVLPVAAVQAMYTATTGGSDVLTSAGI